MSSSIVDVVREKYAATARAGLSSENHQVRAVAEAFGYSADELRSIPAEANMGLSCGNPVATAKLRAGEVVVDLGSGGGLDVFLAAAKVGPTGRAIGIDMTQDMIDLARRNAQNGPDGRPYANVEFHLSTIDKLPLPDASADVILSNCVINLAPDKPAVFREMFRVLKPGGRVAVSDIVLKQPLPEEIRQDVMAYVGCIAGAVMLEDYLSMLRDAGFADVVAVDENADLNAYARVDGQAACCAPTPAEPVSIGGEKKVSLAQSGGCCGGGLVKRDGVDKPMHAELSGLLERHDVNAYAASMKIFAIKPGGGRDRG